MRCAGWQSFHTDVWPQTPGHMGSLVRSGVFACQNFLPHATSSSLVFDLPTASFPSTLNMPELLRHLNKLLLDKPSTLCTRALILFHMFLFITKCLNQRDVFTIITFLTSIQSSTHCHLVCPQASTETALTHVTNSPQMSNSKGCPWADVADLPAGLPTVGPFRRLHTFPLSLPCLSTSFAPSYLCDPSSFVTFLSCLCFITNPSLLVTKILAQSPTSSRMKSRLLSLGCQALRGGPCLLLPLIQ